jgi:hypothetical protein
MKIALPYLLFFIAFNSFAQITLDHIYKNSAVTRIKLEYSGEKYYEIKRETNELFFYNSDRTLWKTIVLPATIPHMLAPTAEIIDVSETKINPDNNIEVIFVYFNTVTNVKDCKIISENGTTLAAITNISSVELSEISGLSNKLIATGTTETKIFSFPELVLENTYNYGNLKRIKLENSGEKYYLLDKVNKNANIYSANHSLLKTVSLPKPTNTTYTDIDFVSETKINPDALLEIGYSLSETVNNTTTYLSKIVNENNVELLSVPNSRKLQISSIEGLQDKLIAELPIDFYIYNTNIYTLPTLNLEKSYESQMTRVLLENSGEKYYTSYNPSNNQVKIYNSNHTLWKTIELTTDNTFFINNITTVSSISESKINSDSSIELVYTYDTGLLGFCCGYSSRVINEQGTVLFDAVYVRNLKINEIKGLANKLTGYQGYTGTNVDSPTNVYSLGNLSTSDFNKKDKVVIAPNPAKSFININSFSVPIIEAKIYNMNGILVKKESAQNITKIEVNQLQTGIYIVNLTDFNNQKSTHKITVSH